ncbi:TonB-dependent receptor [Ideonella sp. BN130291]|uniref:TonB-dependent receptor n=1 Tax=Ideonella sp. BN130291 TaxID=3112940 RepID=UPI002E265F45|nr:TonB-dependent siderophore receptor [Ideonella sp. BN130291]
MNPTAVPLSLRAAALALAFGTAHAQQAPKKDEPEAALPEIKASATRERDNGVAATGAKFETPLRDVPQSVTVIDRKMLDSQAAASLKDSLRNVPGITLGAGEGGVIGDNINLRGFSARTDIYLDGLRDRGQYSRDVFSLEAIEVLKGPSSMLFGRGSTGGVINQITKKPDLRERGEVGVTVGTDDYYRVSADVNHQLSDTSAARLSVFGQDVQSTRDVTRNRDWGVAPSVRLGINTPTEVTVSALIQRNRDLPDYGFPFVSRNGAGTVREPIHAPADRFYGYADDHFNQSVNLLTAVVQHKLSASTTLRNRTLVSHNTTEASPSPLGTVSRIGGGVPSLNDPLEQLQAPRQDRDRVLKDKTIANQTDLNIKFNAGGMAHTLTTGVEIARDENREDRYVWNTATANATVNLGNPSLGERSGERALSRTLVTTADTLALYVNDQVEITPQWKLVVGVRGERFKASSQLDLAVLPTATPPFPADTTLPATPKSETAWTPRAGVIYQPNDAQSWYLSYGTSFNPSAEAVTQSASTGALDAEKNRSVETGVKWDLLDGELTLTGALFRTEKTNARTRDGTGNVQVTAGRLRVQGLEFTAAGRITPAWQVFGGYTFLQGRIVKSPEQGTGVDLNIPAQGKSTPNTPRHQATVWTTYRVTPQWEVGGGVLYSAERWLNNFETAQLPGFTRYDATVAYLQKNYELRLNLQNLSDKAYFEAASAGRATPVRGRTALLSALVRF